jgi:hypothetical protein
MTDFELEGDDKDEKKPKESKATVIVNLVKDSNILFFKDDGGVAHAWVPVDGHKEIWRLDSTEFKEYLRRIYFDMNASVVTNNAIKDAADTLGAISVGTDMYRLNNRVIFYKDAIWYDMSDKDWRAIRIDGNGWDRFDHQKPQTEPVRTNSSEERKKNLWKIFDFHNVKEERDRLLDAVHLVASLIPNIPHPITIVFGPAGSGKTKGFHRSTKLIIDPSNINDGLSLPSGNKKNEIVLHFYRHFYVIYSNVSYLGRDQSDMLCRAVDGTGNETRKLYHDNDMMSYRYQRCIGINSIPLVGAFEDLIDRALLFELEAIENGRLRDAELEEMFESERGKIFGAILDTLSEAMKIFPTINIGYVERLADFTVWGCAIAIALGFKQDDFLTAYAENRDQANREIVDEDILARNIVDFMAGRVEWAGTPSVFFKELEEFVFGEKKTRPKAWPKDAVRMSKHIRRVGQPLKRIGIDISFERSGKSRTINISWLPEHGPKEVQKEVTDFGVDIPSDDQTTYLSKADKMLLDWLDDGLALEMKKDKDALFELVEQELVEETKAGGPYHATSKGVARIKELRNKSQ